MEAVSGQGSTPEFRDGRVKGMLIGPTAVSSILGAFFLISLSACGGSPAHAVAASPTQDSVTRTYLALVHDYWIQYKTAEGDFDHISGISTGPFSDRDAAKACLGLPSPSLPQDVKLVNPLTCGHLSAAMLAVHENFLRALESTQVPAKFAADDRAFRSQLPKAIADLKAMIAAANTRSKEAVLLATTAYVDDMIPTVTDALNDVEPSVLHN
jgi:hypothetical protein